MTHPLLVSQKFCQISQVLRSRLFLAVSLLKMFPGADFMKVGGSLGSEGMLSSVLRVQASSRVSGGKKSNFNAQGCHDRASDRMQWCRSHNLLTATFSA